MQAADVPARAQEQPHSEPVDSQCTTEAADSQVVWVAGLLWRACPKARWHFKLC